MLGLLLLTAITTFQPPRPTVGDPITIDFAMPTVVDPSADYEVVSRNGNRVVIRTFVPHTIAVTGRAADGPVSVMVPIHSVLKADDKLEPAPLKPPKSEPWPRLPFIAIGVAALAAIAAWVAVVLLAKRRMATPRIVVVPVDEFRARVLALQRAAAPMRWARLADAVRAYLAAVRADLGAELTTSEILQRIGDDATIAQVLRQGDLEKFSPWGAAAASFDEVAGRVLEIPAWAEPVKEAA
ncbi:MAG: hypothetical protein M3P29_02130 [Acidobacteriota bacterium]|nr:hypothetical protein [Acidobacteriota bacterium]